jgi:flavin reductase (DIM6/NTAB) family NADH-FMN oxidoreductase RutF
MKLILNEFGKMLVRPTVVITTISPGGVSNAAPFSFSSPVVTRPTPLFGFCCEVEHDTWRNIQENREFVVNLVGADFGPIIEVMERDFPYEVSEINECGLTELESNHVGPPRIREAYGWFECRMSQYVSLSDRAVWVIGEVLEAEIKDEALDIVVSVEKVKPLSHIWGEHFVTEMMRTRLKRA